MEAFGPTHGSAAFACGVAALDAYLRTQANQDMRRRASACYVALDQLARPTPDYPQVAACYTLAAAGVALTDLPAALAKRLPRYPSVPVARVGRTLFYAHHGFERYGAVPRQLILPLRRFKVTG
jgi:hypothetical protein